MIISFDTITSLYNFIHNITFFSFLNNFLTGHSYAHNFRGLQLQTAVISGELCSVFDRNFSEKVVNHLGRIALLQNAFFNTASFKYKHGRNQRIDANWYGGRQKISFVCQWLKIHLLQNFQIFYQKVVSCIKVRTILIKPTQHCTV
jgi:hypothetical protein